MVGRLIISEVFQSTLPREERRLYIRASPDYRNFNPRSHERSDKPDSIGDFGKTEFQSTLPREERQILDFPKETDRIISIHAPTRGATAILHKKFVYFYTIPTINI